MTIWRRVPNGIGLVYREPVSLWPVSPFRNHGFGIGFGFRLSPLVWSPQRVYAKHAEYCQAKPSRIWSEAVVSKRAYIVRDFYVLLAFSSTVLQALNIPRTSLTDRPRKVAVWWIIQTEGFWVAISTIRPTTSFYLFSSQQINVTNSGTSYTMRSSFILCFSFLKID